MEGEVSIWNHLHLRGENGNETKPEWNDILFDWVNSNRLMITGLSPDTTYSVCGLYEVLENCVWSELSEPHIFTTKSGDDAEGPRGDSDAIAHIIKKVQNETSTKCD